MDSVSKKYLIVNADDFGQSRGINRGIIEAHERGIVTSASLMVRWPAVAEAAAYSRSNPSLSLGIHIDLGEWKYRDGEWLPFYEVVRLDDEKAVASEILRQIEVFRNILGSNPTHIDSHQHVHVKEPARAILSAISADFGVPLRCLSTSVRYCGDFYGQSTEGRSFPELITAVRLIDLLVEVHPGVTELGCHPGYVSDLDTEYREERALEIRALCDPRVRSALEAAEINLISFHQVTSS
ncbi:MAG TPA: ChbG/HpnK family deacetylase [Candidatus Binatia bacterium]